MWEWGHPSPGEAVADSHDTAENAEQEEYTIGVIGAGHWAIKFKEALDSTPITFSKAVDIVPYDDNDVVDNLGIAETEYKEIKSGSPLPDDFFEDVDVVQVASPIQFHAEQTRQAMEQADVVVTEKAYGPTPPSSDADVEEPADVVSSTDRYASVMEQADDTVLYPHLHYLRKQPTQWLRDNISDVVEEYGRIERVEATFIEEVDDEDIRRSWVLNPENGGIVMDWIHPVEVLTATCDATFEDVVEATGYITNEQYSTDHPTATRTTYSMDGDLFADDAESTVRVGKGFDPGYTWKAMRFDLENAALDVVYTGSGTERSTDYRGQILLHDSSSDRLTATAIETPEGPTPYELMAEDMQNAVEQDEIPDMLNRVQDMYATVDMTNEAVYGREFVTDGQEIYDLVQDGIKKTSL